MEARQANAILVDKISEIATRKRANPAQIALAWLLAQKPWIALSPGATKTSRLDENLAAADIELTASDLADIEAAIAGITVQGDRYPAFLAGLTGR